MDAAQKKTKLQQGFDLVDQMNADELDQLVDYIRQVFKTKRTHDAARMYATLKLGDRVQFNDNNKPKYLNGQTAVVVEKKDSRISVRLDRGPQGKFRTGTVLAPASALIKLED